MKSKLLKIFLFMMIFSLILLPCSPVSAHRMMIEPVEEGVIKVYYEGGQIARRAEVVVYDQNNREIARNGVDAEGYFQYPLDKGDVMLIADDGMGHRAEWKIGEGRADDLPRGPTVAIVLAGFCLIAGLFHYRVKKKEG